MAKSYISYYVYLTTVKKIVSIFNMSPHHPNLIEKAELPAEIR